MTEVCRAQCLMCLQEAEEVTICSVRWLDGTVSTNVDLCLACIANGRSYGALINGTATRQNLAWVATTAKKGYWEFLP